MKKVQFMLNNGKILPMKLKMAEHLEYAGKGCIVRDPEPPSVTASDAVREEADALGVDLAEVAGSGKDGRILKRDLQSYQTRMLKAE
jgi:pyruvate/2-oxoglutarate dehydrogenase complex dihydrolipoamide acyltransferase (E2) component